MDPNLYLALLAATRDDLEALLDDPREALLEEPLGEDFSYPEWPSLSWPPRRPREAFEALTRELPREQTLLRSLEELPDFALSARMLDLRASALRDLAPLSRFGSLELLRLGVTEDADLTPLLALSSLRRVALYGAPGGAAHPVLVALAARGVLVDDPAPDWAALSAPFADRNLALAVANHLHHESLPAELPTFDEHRLDEGNLARILSLPRTPQALAAVEELTWDEGGLEVHHLVYEQWDGEDDTFSLRSLQGLEALSALRQLACYTQSLPPAQLDALVSRGVLLYEAPFPPALLATPHALPLGALAALLFATRNPSHFPRNFWLWPLSERERFLRQLPLDRELLWAEDTHAPTLRWRADPWRTWFPTPWPPSLLLPEGAPADTLAVLSLEHLLPAGRAAQVLDLPLSRLESLAPLRDFRELHTVHLTVTPHTDLAPLAALRRLRSVELHGAASDAQREPLRALEQRDVTVLTR